VERTLGQWLRLQWIVSLALLPATLMLFQQFSLLAPLANLIAIPWVSVTVVPLTLLAVLVGLLNPSAQAGLLKIAELTMDWLWGYLAWLSNLSWASLPWPAPPLWSLGFALPGLILLLAPRGLPGRWLGGILCLPLLYFPKAAPAPGEVWFSLLDVGPGLAAVVRTATHTLVYDTGPRWSAGFDAGRSAVLPSLRQQGVTSVDTLILSHADNAHVGGTRTLLEQLEVAQVLTSSLVAVPVAGAQPCREGQEWRWDGVRFRLLHPPVVGKFSGDNASCVLLVEGKAGSILLPGDSGSAAQAALVKRYGDALAVQVLVAPHHGTREEVLTSFLTHVNPRYVLFSTGSDNRYPTAETGLYYRQTGATVLDTAQHGCISFRITARQALIPELYRQQVRRYWHIP
jgi:competence protein ComEC